MNTNTSKMTEIVASNNLFSIKASSIADEPKLHFVAMTSARIILPVLQANLKLHLSSSGRKQFRMDALFFVILYF